MGEFFNQVVKKMHKIPDSKTLEKMRREFNERTLHSESTEESGVILGDGGNTAEPQLDVLSTQNGEEPVRPVREKRTRKTRRDKGKRHQQNHR